MSTVLALYRCTATPNLSFGGAVFANSWLSFDISQIAELATFKAALANGANAVTARTITQIQLPAMRDDLDIYAIPNDNPTLIPGPRGLSIAGASIANGRFRFTLSDNSVIDGGPVPVSTTPGPAGRGIATAVINVSGHLILTMTDGSQIDCGLLPGVTPAAPTWTVNPTITDDGTPTVGETLTGSDGTVLGGTITTRQWLLNGSAISGATGATYVTAAEGSYVFRVGATGGGGSATQDSSIHVVGPAPTPTPSPTPSPVFSSPPYFMPFGGYANVTQFTADNGIATNTNSASTRRWLLDGAAIGTGPTVTPAAAGALLLEVTAHGLGGDTIYTTDPVDVVVAADPVASLTKTTGAGTNPMRWSSKYSNMIPDVDQIGADWKIDAGAWNSCAAIPFTHDMFLDGEEDGFWTVNWAEYLAQTFASGHLVTVREWVLRAGVKYYSTTTSDGAATVSDTPVTSIIPVNRGGGSIDYNYGTTPIAGPIPAVTVVAHDKLVVNIGVVHNGAGDISTVTANVGAITFTRIDALPDDAVTPDHNRMYAYYCEDVGAITSLNLVITPTGSTRGLAFTVDAVNGAVAGGPHASQKERRPVTNEDPHIGMNDGLAPVTNGALVTAMFFRGAIAPMDWVGATTLGRFVDDGTVGMIGSAKQLAAASLSIVGYGTNNLGYGTMYIMNTEWRSS